MSRRVVITGIGLASGIGVGAEAVWEALRNGQSGIRPIEQFDATAFPVRYAAQVDASISVRNYVPKTYRKALKVMCRDVELAVVGAANAVEDAALVTKANADGDHTPTYAANRMGCQIGAGLIVAEINELTTAYAKARQDDGAFSYTQWGENGMHELTPLWLLKYLPNMLACHVTIVHDCQGPSNTITCGEASGALSIGESRRVIERGDADACFTGGAESKINPLGVLRQWYAGNMARTTDVSNPAQIVRPFSNDATGSVPGEAAAVLMVEAEEKAQQRGARIYAEITGFGASVGADLSHCPPKPESSGSGLRAAIEHALKDANTTAESIDAIVPMGMGAPDYDRCENAALSAVFGDRLDAIPLILTKPYVGVCGAAASALDVAVGALCLHHQQLPKPLGTDANASIKGAMEQILVCGVGFGGQHTAVVLKRFEKAKD